MSTIRTIRLTLVTRSQRLSPVRYKPCLVIDATNIGGHNYSQHHTGLHVSILSAVIKDPFLRAILMKAKALILQLFQESPDNAADAFMDVVCRWGKHGSVAIICILEFLLRQDFGMCCEVNVIHKAKNWWTCGRQTQAFACQECLKHCGDIPVAMRKEVLQIWKGQ